MSPSAPSERSKIPFQANPFTNMAVGSPWAELPADVASINNEAFQLLRRDFRQVCLGSDPISVMVTGEPGSGKTHLLSRFKRHLEAQAEGGKPWYVYVRCNTSARTLWRHLRLSLATDLLHVGSDGRSRLEELVREQKDLLRHLNHLGVHRALENLVSGRNTLAATAWLRGEPLADADLAALGIGVERDDEERSRETEAKHIVGALLQLLSPAPVVICFDQVEALETYRGEMDGYHTLGQMVAELVNGKHGRLLLISCIVSDYEGNLEKLPNKADRDRWLQDKATLKPIEWESAVELIKARLDSAPALATLRSRHGDDPLWPLEKGPLLELFAQTGRCLPRTLIQGCKIEFARQMGDIGPGPVNPEDFLQQEYGRFVTQARLEWRKSGGETVLQDGLPWLLQNSGSTVLDQSNTAAYANMAYRCSSGELALVFCYSSGNSYTNALRKTMRYWTGKPDLKILSDPTIQPKPGSRGAQYLQELKTRGAVQLHPLPEALAALRAIRNLTATARAGELNLDGKVITEDEATKWALANLPRQLETLREELTVKTADPPDPEDGHRAGLLALLNRQKVVEAQAAARELSLSAEEVASCARRYPMHFGLLEGPPLVLFEAVEGSEAEAPDA
jgi:hypothetical protein